MSRKQKAPPTGRARDSATAFREDLPDHPLQRFFTGFFFAVPIIWIVTVGYGSSSASDALEFALIVGFILGLIAAVGKKPLAWIMNFFIHGGL